MGTVRTRFGLGWNGFPKPLEGHVSKGRYNRIEVDDAGLAILKRAKDLELLHGDLRTVRSLLRTELPNKTEASPANGDGNGTKHASDAWAKVIETLEAEVAYLRRENDWLRQRLEELQRLALPAPAGDGGYDLSTGALPW